MLRFAGFEFDPSRAELRRPDGTTVKLRRKTLELLTQFARTPRQVLDKQELMAAVWPNVHVADDSLFQCIRELRVALGDEKRELIAVVSGQGYRLNADVTEVSPPSSGETQDPGAPPVQRRLVSRGLMLGGMALAAAAIALAATLVWPVPTTANRLAVAIVPLEAGSDPSAQQMAASVTSRVIDGLAKIAAVQVLSGSAGGADFVLSGELEQAGAGWEAQARLTETRNGEVVWATTAAAEGSTDLHLQRARLAAGIGHELAIRLNAMVVEPKKPAVTSKVVIEQATAYINQTSQERWQAAEAMLETGLAQDPDSVELQAALAAVIMRGVQMSWYGAEGRGGAEARARALLERALQARPDSLPVQEAYCRFLTTINAFTDTLVACARALTFDPWNGIALYHIGLAQLQLGRFEDALATFTEADQFDTPQVSRWTWTLGAGWALVMMGEAEKALPWLTRSIAITPASGRPYFLLSAALQQLGRTNEAAAAMAKGLELRPGSTALNIGNPPENASPVYLAAAERVLALNLAAGLPEK